MSSIPYRRTHAPAHSRSLTFVKQMGALELIWPILLLVLGILQLLNPILIGLAVTMAIVPWVMRLVVLRYLTPPTFVGGAMTLFVLGGVVGTWVAYDPVLSWPTLLTLLGSVSLFFAMANAGFSRRGMAGGLVVISSLAAFYFVGQYGHFELPEEVGRLARLGRLTGSLLPDFVFYTPHPNAMAGFLEGTFWLSLVLIWRARGGERIIWGISSVLLAYGLLISGSRGSWLGLAVSLAIGLLLSIPNRKLRLTAAGLGGLFVMLSVLAITRLIATGQQGAIISSALYAADGRLRLYRNSLYLLSDYPFSGIGLGETFAMVYSRYQLLIQVPFLTYPHNLLLGVGLGYGVLGLVALGWLLIGFYRFVARVERVGLNARWYPFFRAGWLGVTTILVHGLTDSPQFGGANWTMPLLFALMGFVVATGHLVGIDSELRGTGLGNVWRSGRRFWIGAAVAVVTVLVGGYLYWQPILSAGYSNLGAIYHTKSELTPDLRTAGRTAAAARASAFYTKALKLNPALPTANRRLGLLALERHDFDAAMTYLERAYQNEPGNQATLKALGLAYLWTGRLDSAEEMLGQLDEKDEMVEELGAWSWWWGTQDRDDLASYAEEMVERLS